MSVANSYQTQKNLKLETSAWFQAEVLRESVGTEPQIEIKGFKNG